MHLSLAALLAGMTQGVAPDGSAELQTQPPAFVLANLTGLRATAGGILAAIDESLALALVPFFLFAMLRWLLRPVWLATAAFCVVAYLLNALQPGFRGDWITTLGVLMAIGIWVVAAERFGFLLVLVATCMGRILVQSTLTSDFTEWYGRSSLGAVLLVTVLAMWAFRTCLKGRAGAGMSSEPLREWSGTRD